MGLASILNVGIRSLDVYGTALDITSQNIAHADEKNYHRREVDFTENPFYSGVKVSDIRRIINDTAETKLQNATSDVGKTETYLQNFTSLEPTFDSSAANLSKKINESLESLRLLESDATSQLNRGLFGGGLASLVDRFKAASSELDRQVKTVNSSISETLKHTNSILNSLATINNQIINTPSDNNSALLDQRSGLVHELAKYFNFTTEVTDTNILNISLSNGMQILGGLRVNELQTMPDPTNSAYLTIGMANGSATIQVTDYMQSGQLVGLLNFRSEGVDASRVSLNRLALVISSTLNEQNKLGVDLQGNLGGNIFADINSAGTMSDRVIPDLRNSGAASMSVEIVDTTKIAATDYKLSIGDSSAYVLTRISDNVIVSSGTLTNIFPQTLSNIDGFDITIASGTFNSGDQYIISPANKAASNMSLSITTDGTQLALGWPVVVGANTQNKGLHQTITVSSMSDTTTSAFSTPGQLSPPIKIVFTDSTHYNILNADTNVAVIPGGPFTYDPNTSNDLFPPAYAPGYQITLSGTIVVGDEFNATYNSSPQNDDRNGIAMEAIYNSDTILNQNGQLVTFTEAYGLIINDIAVKMNTAQSRYEDNVSQQDVAYEWVQSISGVSLPEEAMNLQLFQQSYQASAQILQSARTVLETVISLGRR